MINIKRNTYLFSVFVLALSKTTSLFPSELRQKLPKERIKEIEINHPNSALLQLCQKKLNSEQRRVCTLLNRDYRNAANISRSQGQFRTQTKLDNIYTLYGIKRSNRATNKQSEEREKPALKAYWEFKDKILEILNRNSTPHK